MEHYVGEKIKELRIENKDTLKSLAEKIRYDWSNLSKVERGVYGASVDMLNKIATIYNVEPNYFFKDSYIGSYGELIQKQRKKLNISQAELADKLGVNPSFLSRVEQGKQSISLNRLTQISNLLGMKLFEQQDQSYSSLEKWVEVIKILEEKELTPEEVINIINTIDIIKRKL